MLPVNARRAITDKTASELEQRHPRDTRACQELDPHSTFSATCSTTTRRPLLEIKVSARIFFWFDLTTLGEKRKALHNSPVYKQLLD